MAEADRDEVAKILQRPFLPNEIGKLPRGGIQIDYVGHADVTRRLLEADPEWNWEPVATDEHGLPVFDTGQNGQPVGLWIKLTVGGVTRLGYGSVPASQSDAVKVLIGDALRNAAMRFGVALDLWAKGDRADPTAENSSGAAGHAAGRGQRSAGEAFQDARPAGNGNGAPHGKAGRPARAAAVASRDAVTNIDWMGHLVSDLIPSASTREELMGFWENVDEYVRDGKCTDKDAADVRGMVTVRARELGFEKASAA